MRALRVGVGIAVWIAVLGTGGWILGEKVRSDDGGPKLTEQLGDFITVARRVFVVESAQPLRIAIGDPVFADEAPGSRPIGEVVKVFDEETSETGEGVTRAEIVVYSNEYASRAAEELQVVVYASPDSLAGTVATMLPRSKQREIAETIREAIEENRHEIVAQLKPIVEKSLRESVVVVEQELTAAIKRHRPELAKLGAKYQNDLIKSEVVPIVRKEILPIVREHVEPLAESIGANLWKKVSVWSFGWRYLYDASPLPRRDRVRKEWKRFVETAVVPELESRSDEIVTVVQKIFTDAARNPKVRQAFRRNLTRVLEDREVHRIVWTMFREVMIDSPRVRKVLEDNWKSPEARRAFRIASDRFEPTAVRIGELLFGTPEHGITPEFAAVLRREILHKDQRWLVLSTADPTVSGTPGVVSLSHGGTSSEFPGPRRGTDP